MRIRLDRSPPRYRGMERLGATVSFDAPLRVTKGEWQIVWHTEGKGDEDVGVATQGFFEAGEYGRGGDLRIETQLPRGPWSYNGRLVKIIWELQVQFSLRGGDEVEERAIFELGPTTDVDVAAGQPS